MMCSSRKQWCCYGLLDGDGVEERQLIVEETLEAGSSVARVALQHGVNANQVFKWRRLHEAGRLGTATFLEVLQCVARCNLFEIPSTLRPFIERNELEDDQFDEEVSIAEGNNEPKPGSSQLEAWRIFLETPYNQIDSYAAHVRETGPFGTHQGVKGLQFDRVMVVLDDKTARGFLFSYENCLRSLLQNRQPTLRMRSPSQQSKQHAAFYT
jgi:hypothetical protein